MRSGKFSTVFFLGLFLLVMILLSGCAAMEYENEGPAKEPQTCENIDDCKLPRNIAIKSTCPFKSRCIEGECVALCELKEICTDDESCSCMNYRGYEEKECKCINGRCNVIPIE